MIGESNPGKKVVGYGWVGMYRGRGEHRLGFVMPQFISHNYGSHLDSEQLKVLGRVPDRHYAKADMWRVKITLEPVKDRRGKYVVRRVKKVKV